MEFFFFFFGGGGVFETFLEGSVDHIIYRDYSDSALFYLLARTAHLVLLVVGTASGFHE